jgi:hypothetical protein
MCYFHLPGRSGKVENMTCYIDRVRWKVLRTMGGGEEIKLHPELKMQTACSADIQIFI